MHPRTLAEQIISTLADGRLSRTEQRALRAVIADHELNRQGRQLIRSALFTEAGSRCRDPRDRALLEWLADALRLLDPPASQEPHPATTAFFGPGDEIISALEEFVGETRQSLDVAVFTITDDRLARALVALHRRGIQVRILSDNDKAWDMGSDIDYLRQAGIALELDCSPHHFHHKFAIRDRKLVLNGSYNWTRSAHRFNRENFLISQEPALVEQYCAEFDRLWAELRPPGQ